MLPIKTPVAKEGYPFIGFAALLTLVLAALGSARSLLSRRPTITASLGRRSARSPFL